MLAWTLAAGALAHADADTGVPDDALCRTVLDLYHRSLEDTRPGRETVAQWHALVLALLSAAPTSVSRAFLLAQLDKGAEEAEGDDDDDDDGMEASTITTATTEGEGGAKSRLERVLLGCACERVRVLYEHALVHALRRVEAEERAALEAADLATATGVADVAARVPGLCVAAVAVAALRLLEPARAAWRRLRQTFALLLDVARLSPACVRLLLAADIGGEYCAWFLNEPTPLAQNRPFISPSLLPDLAPFFALLAHVHASPVVGRGTAAGPDAAHAQRLVAQLFDAVFVSEVARYPYSPATVRALLAAHCRDDAAASARVWTALRTALVEAPAGQRPVLDAHVVHYCCALGDTLVSARIAHAFGLASSLDSDSDTMGTSLLALWTSRVAREPGRARADAVLLHTLCAQDAVRAVLRPCVRRVLWLEQAARARAVATHGRDFGATFRVQDVDGAALLRLPRSALYAMATPPPLVAAYNVVRFTCEALAHAALACDDDDEGGAGMGDDGEGEAAEAAERVEEHRQAMTTMIGDLRGLRRQKREQRRAQQAQPQERTRMVDDDEAWSCSSISTTSTSTTTTTSSSDSNKNSAISSNNVSAISSNNASTISSNNTSSISVKEDISDSALEFSVQQVKSLGLKGVTDDQIRAALRRNHNDPNLATAELFP